VPKLRKKEMKRAVKELKKEARREKKRVTIEDVYKNCQLT